MRFRKAFFAECLLHDDALAGHLSGDRQADIGQHGGGDICQAATLAQLHIAAANGHETFDTDASAVAAEAGDLICERYVLSQGHVQIELLDNLDKVAPAGAILLAAWPNIEGATGLPVRVVAVTPK